MQTSETDSTLLNVGRAYSGLTDLEIAELTDRFKAITTEQFGRFHVVRPEVVLEITFDIVQKSNRHKAGYECGTTSRLPRSMRYSE